MLARSAGRRRKLVTNSTRIAAASATTTDHTPPTAPSEVPPHCGSARKLVSMCGRTTNDISRLTAITTPRGNAARAIGGGALVRWP